MDLFPAPTLHLFKAGSGVVIPPLIVEENPTVSIRHPSHGYDIIGHHAELLLAFAQRFLCFRADDDFCSQLPIEIFSYLREFVLVRAGD